MMIELVSYSWLKIIYLLWKKFLKKSSSWVDPFPGRSVVEGLLRYF